MSGQVIINAARLLEAPDLSLGIVVSDFIYHSVIQHADVLSEPGAFTEIDVIVKEATLRGWMQMVDPTLRSQRGVFTVTAGAARGWVGQAG